MSSNFLIQLLRTRYIILIILVMLFYHTDEPSSYTEESLNIHWKNKHNESLRNQIKAGFSKYEKIRLQRSIKDIRQF